MDFLMNPLNLMTFFPLVGVAIILLIPRERKDAIRWTAVLTSLVSFFISLGMLMAFRAQNPDFQMVYDKIWMKAGDFEIHYALGVDGLSILLVLLTTLLTPISIFSAWTAIEDRVKEFAIAFLVMEVGMLGVFLALDLFTFFVFIQPHTDVFHHRYLGRPAAHVCSHQVHALHHGRLGVDAVGHFVAGLEPGHVLPARPAGQRR